MEKNIRNKIMKYAERRGFWPVLYSDGKRRGAPDTAFFGMDGRVFFIEFKESGKKPRAEQINYHEQLYRFGFKTYVVDDIYQGQKIIDREILKK